MPSTDRKDEDMISMKPIALLLIAGAAGCTAQPPDQDGQWTRGDLESLFPAAPDGWTASEMKLDELETFAQKSGVEGTGKAAGDVAGDEPLAPGVRYKLAVEYEGPSGSVVVEIDSEQLAALQVILPLNGYEGYADDGSLEPLAQENQRIRDGLFQNGLRPVTFKGQLGMSFDQDANTGIAFILGKHGTITYRCDYPGCRNELSGFVELSDFDRLNAFAVYDHRQAGRTD